MKLYKKVCSCGHSWLSDDRSDFECVYGTDNHIVTNSKNLTSIDYAEMWSSDLENANRHSLADMPNIILSIVKKITKSEPQTLKIMKELFEMEVGI